ncbi:MAG: S-adenosylmethionine:tRNA ribosyltransferase-isomerase, partial [Oscillospiraceae bacterium]
MLLSEFDYELPEELIAQMPADKRQNSRMMVLNRDDNTILHKHFYDIVDLIDENSLLVLNNTKVIPARLFAHKDTGALIEIFLLKECLNKHWEVLIKPSKRVKCAMVLEICPKLSIEIVERYNDGKWLAKLIYDGNLYEILDEVGNIPLPPYIERKMTNDELKSLDFERYQTVYAKKEGSVAAPTAGLHFTDEILESLKAKGVEIAYVTLNVGLGTFRPVKCDNVLEHKMDSEKFEI